MLERRTTVEPKARNAHNGELDSQHIALLARRIIARRTASTEESGVALPSV